MSGALQLAYAWRSLRRGGQRSVIAMVCVAFGVMSLVALQQLAAVINDALLTSPRVARGADLILSRADGSLGEAEIASLEDFDFAAISPVINSRAMLLKTARSGRATILSQAVGVDPSTYPLYGTVQMREPAGASPAEVLDVLGGAIITRDLARRYGLGLGDGISIVGSPTAPPFELHVAGIAQQNPAHQGLSVLFSLDTARDRGLGGITSVSVRTNGPVPAAQPEELQTRGWSVWQVPERPEGEAPALFGFMLAAAGILGLLIGGIGVSNTMQVVLARRTQEIATLKTLGYRQSHLLWMFGLEAGMLGTIGSAVGVGLGVPVARGLTGLIGQSMPTLLTFRVSPAVVAGGLVMGILTTLLFGTLAIVRAADVRPSLLLRDLAVPATGRQRTTMLLLQAGLLVMFGVLASAVLASWWKGLAVVGAGLIGLAGLGVVLAGVLAVVVRVPLGPFPLLGMARRNLRHQPLRSVYALVAFFVGVVAIGFATVVLDNAFEQLQARQMDLTGINARVYASGPEEPRLMEALRNAGVDVVHADFRTEVQVRDSRGHALKDLTAAIGRRDEDMLWNLPLGDDAAGTLAPPPGIAVSHAVYLPQHRAEAAGLAVGDTLLIRGPGGDATVRLAGTFPARGGGLALAAPPDALVMPLATLQSVGPAELPLQLNVAVEQDRLAATTEALGRAVPSSVVIGKDAIGDAIAGFFRGLFWFAVSVAGLALVAGAVLIANSVGLAMVERRRELGVLKAVGYSRGAVLWTVVLENALLGLIGGGLGVAGVAVVVGGVNLRFPAAGLEMGVVQTVSLLLAAVGLAVLSAILVAWHPTRVRPLEVLRTS